MDWCGRHGSHKYEKIEPHDHYFTYLGNMDWCGRHGSHKYEKIEPHDHYFTYLGNMDWCGRHGSHKYEKIEPHDPLNGPVELLLCAKIAWVVKDALYMYSSSEP